MPSYDELGSARKMAIMIALVGSQGIQMIPFGTGIVTSLDIGEQIGATEGTAVWLAASYPMTQGAFVLIGGRFGDVFGHKKVLLTGVLWWALFSLITGFAKSLLTISLFRGLMGIGAAFISPNAVALLGQTFPPGRWRNISMGLFGAMAPIGAAGGSVISALFVQLTEWRWLFFFFTILGAVLLISVFLLVPYAEPSDKGGKIDWVGAYFGVGGLILFNFVWNQAPLVGWQNPYEYTLLIVSILHFLAFLFWESKITSAPIIPISIFTAPSILPLVVVVFLSFMSFGIFLWYFFLWTYTIRGQSMLSFSVEVQPLAVGGAFAAFVAAYLISRLSAQYILAIGSSAMLLASILLATMPAQQIYWQTAFIAILFASFCPDFIFTAAQIIASNSVTREQQGVAGSLIGTLLSYGISTGLGFGGTVEVHTNKLGTDIVKGFRSALYLGIGFSAMSLVLSLLFVRIKKDEREGWGEKDVELETPKSEEVGVVGGERV